MSFIDAIGAIFKPVSEVIDHLTVSGDQKVALQQAALQAQAATVAQAAVYEQTLLESQTKVITAEATGESWLQRNWRPLTMLSFVVIIFWTWFRGPPPHMTEAVVLEVFTIIKIGLGGYVAGRSGEKIAKTIPAIIQAVKGA